MICSVPCRVHKGLGCCYGPSPVRATCTDAKTRGRDTGNSSSGQKSSMRVWRGRLWVEFPRRTSYAAMTLCGDQVLSLVVCCCGCEILCAERGQALLVLRCAAGNADSSNARLQRKRTKRPHRVVEALQRCHECCIPSLAPVSHRAVSFRSDVKGGVGRGLRHLASGPPTEPACRKKPFKFAW